MGNYFNGYAIKDIRGLALDQWRIPTILELETLANVGVNKLRAISTWTDNLGTDNYGFELKLSGKVNQSGIFSLLQSNKEASFLWTSDKLTATKINYFILVTDNTTQTPTPNTSSRNWGMPIRLIKD